VIGQFAAGAMSMSFLITLVYNKGRQSLPLVMLLHCTVNNFSSVAWSQWVTKTAPGRSPDWVLQASQEFFRSTTAS
jgi:hypothetical protein